MTDYAQPTPEPDPQLQKFKAQSKMIGDRVWLLAVAARQELCAVLQAIYPDFDLKNNLPEQWTLCPCGVVDVVYTGVGKASAAGGVARVLDPDRHLGVLSVGIAGAIKGPKEDPGCAVLDVVCAWSSVFADEGVCTPEGFISCEELGFGPFLVPPLEPSSTEFSGIDGPVLVESDSIIHDEQTTSWLTQFVDHMVTIACVSTCSGTDKVSDEIGHRTVGNAEAMEGAAVCLAANRIDSSLLTGELRVISNLTGDRSEQQWDLDGALSKLTQVLGRVIDTLR